MKAKTQSSQIIRLDLVTAEQWAGMTNEQRLDTCQRAQLQATNAELLLRDALGRIAQAMATLNPTHHQ